MKETTDFPSVRYESFACFRKITKPYPAFIILFISRSTLFLLRYFIKFKETWNLSIASHLINKKRFLLQKSVTFFLTTLINILISNIYTAHVNLYFFCETKSDIIFNIDDSRHSWKREILCIFISKYWRITYSDIRDSFPIKFTTYI